MAGGIGELGRDGTAEIICGDGVQTRERLVVSARDPPGSREVQSN